ncbi:PKD domain-containing protein [Colwellia sp. C1TZA3]|uniref:PKD domain-containing protein n=1 Tax=Colwellia sp. C1TZA3 TaxID=2508879 RepID=UPI0011B9DF48|nr:putative Ig domain-containing protein [Colwellia sp. C1TZA3]TWX72804.1 hypothetical protein ESZ39_06870 [Colwellia sp. C1TZA3]
MKCYLHKVYPSSYLKRIISVLIISSVLAACSGGGDGEKVPKPEIGNQSPVANAGSDQSVNENVLITLSGYGTDSDGNISAYSWSQTGGVLVTLENADSAITSFQAPEVNSDEQLSFELSVTDNDGVTSADMVAITIINVLIPPTANAGDDQAVLESTTVTLSGSGTDLYGSISAYSWSQITGTLVTLQNSDSTTSSFQAPEITSDEQLIFEFTVTDNDGTTSADTVEITLLNVVIAPTANAGEDQEALESTTVTLSGSGIDSDGIISSYHWEQVNNGAPIVSIKNVADASTNVDLPELTQNIEFVFRLIVTDNDGESAQDEVVITGRPTPGITVGTVTGNTATVNATAEFSIQLSSRPTANITIPLNSSNESEAITEQSELIFTEDNWLQAQSVIVKGTNENVQNGEQNFQIILGTVTSSDIFYNGLNPDDVNLKGIELTIAKSEVLTPFIADIAVVIQPQVSYTGSSQLSFSLTESPEGMDIDLSTGIINWTPEAPNEGESYTVITSVNDGNKFSEASFEVKVALTTPVEVSMTNNEIEIVEPQLDLLGVKFRFADDSSALPIIKTTTVESVNSAIFKGEKLTELFIANDDLLRESEVLVPISLLPEFSDVTRLAVYHYVLNEESGEQAWSPVRLNLSLEGSADREYAVLDMGALKGIFYIGLLDKVVTVNNNSDSNANKKNSTVISSQPLLLSANQAFTAQDVSCQPRRIERPSNSSFIEDFIEQTCRVTGLDNTIFTVIGFGNAGGATTMWSSAITINEMVLWAAESRNEFDELDIGNFDRNITIQLQSDNIGSYGYVLTNNPVERGNILHLSNRASESSTSMQITLAHQYFHHAQVKTKFEIDNGKNLMTESYNERRWISEGTAMWFEDHLYDTLDDYKRFLTVPLSRVLEKGINSEADRHNNIAIWKHLLNESTCPDFKGKIKGLFYGDFAENDKSRISYVNSILSASSCNFGDHLGAENSASLISALSYYQYATMFENKISLLDANESNTDFNFKPTTYQFDQPFFNTISQWLNIKQEKVHKLNNISNIPAAGAYSFKIPAISGELPAGKIAQLSVESNRKVIVSLTSSDPAFNGTGTIDSNAHTWFSTAAQTSYTYDAEGTVPEVFVTVANPSLATSANVDVFFKIVDKLKVDTIITSHITGAQVSNRVVTISGSIPEEARAATSKIVITANGITTNTALNNDGTFAADVVISLGDNIIKAQGFSGTKPNTIEKVITLQGIESSTTGLNALISSRTVFVLRWDTATDLDIYTTDKNNDTIWYSNKTQGPGNLDLDDKGGFGPEVVSYRATMDDVYVSGTFDLDVHYYSGSPSTNYTLDVILNETEGSNRRSFKFESTTPLTTSSSSEESPTGSGNSRFNDILSVSCSAQRVCTLKGFDTSKLKKLRGSTTTVLAKKTANVGDFDITQKQTKFASVHQQCMDELNASISKTGSAAWSCNEDGTKYW